VGESINWSLVLVILLGFFGGYSIISFLAGRLQQKGSNNRTGDQQPSHEPPTEAAKHAQVLGLKETFTANDVKLAYREMLSKYHPDKLEHLGDEFKDIAAKKTREVVAAYDFFRKEFKII
jgi:DnaJ like chaperone protein